MPGDRSNTAVIVFGPPLPGRAALARALERQLPSAKRLSAPTGEIDSSRLESLLAEGSTPVIECDLPTARDRVRAGETVGKASADPIFVAWTCDPHDVQREIYRRYASIPRRYADRWWILWELDRERREPIGAELEGRHVVTAHSHEPTERQVARVAEALALDPRGADPAPPWRVLLVDDEEDNRALIAEALELLGCQVLQAQDAEGALDIASAEPLDLVISDQHMPGRSGVELAAELATRRPDLHVALLTGFAAETVDAALAEAGVSLLLAKPASALDLLRLLDELACPGEVDS
jgi:CheY-like chemotaxis protein